MQLIPATHAHMKHIKKLYLSAFPKEERPPFWMLKRNCRKSGGEFLAIIDDCESNEKRRAQSDAFCGFAVMIFHADLALLFFFAIAPQKRGRGYGSRALQLLKARYPEKRFFLEVESTLVPSENQAERLRRLAFYGQNGLTPTPLSISLFGVEMQLLTDGSPLTFQEYFSLYENYLGTKMAQYGVKEATSSPAAAQE